MRLAFRQLERWDHLGLLAPTCVALAYLAWLTMGDTLLGTALVIGALLLAVPTAVRELRDWWRSERPFDLAFPQEPFSFDGRRKPFAHTRTLGLGRSILTVVLCPRIQSNISRFNVRFVNLEPTSYGQTWVDAPPHKVRIVGVRVREVDQRHDFQFSANPDGVGGIMVELGAPREWHAGSLLWLELDVESDAAWLGYLSFDGTADGNRKIRAAPR